MELSARDLYTHLLAPAFSRFLCLSAFFFTSTVIIFSAYSLILTQLAGFDVQDFVAGMAEWAKRKRIFKEIW
jgi:hypothetical protein